MDLQFCKSKEGHNADVLRCAASEATASAALLSLVLTPFSLCPLRILFDVIDVQVDLPTGSIVQLSFSASGELAIRCSNFTGEIVLSGIKCECVHDRAERMSCTDSARGHSFYCMRML